MATFKRNSVGGRLFIFAGVDLTLLTGLTFKVKRADGSLFTKTGVKVTIVYVDTEAPCECVDPPTETWPAKEHCYIIWEPTDLSVAGVYQGELSGVFPGGQDYGDTFNFTVEEILS